ncbi:MAG: NAD+ synthase [Actinobacteria bacterium]|nr:NAD+ synthase [Actinomycetota bacterium]
MTSIRLALGQLNATVGDVAGNADLALETARRASQAGADLLALPEMFIPGYPIEDLALRQSFATACMTTTRTLAERLAEEGMAGLTVVIGTLSASGNWDTPLGVPRNEPRNAAWVLRHGEVIAEYNKHHLPNYGVFDEYRYFIPGDQPCFLDVGGFKVSLAICEDLWRESGPVSWTREQGADLLLVINGSPFEEAKSDLRLELCRRQAQVAACSLAYVNLVGGQDELVFGGDSMVVSADGTLLARAAQFDEDLLVMDLSDSGRARSPEDQPLIAPGLSTPEQLYRALGLGLADYVNKNGFPSALIGLSGGIDSALVAALAVDALGAARVHGVAMPSKYSSSHSVEDAQDLANRTGLSLRRQSIEPMFDVFQEELELSGLAEENLQARLRGVTLMALSNQEGHLVLATGNKTELAVGYSTIYGDAVGGFAPIKDLSKTQVWELARWRNRHAEEHGQTPPIPPSSITKPPSAELRPGQLDSDSLPDYPLLDQMLDRYVGQDAGAKNLAAAGFESRLVEEVIRMTDRAEYKRRQYPPGTKVSHKAFGRDRRLPLTSHWREAAQEAEDH